MTSAAVLCFVFLSAWGYQSPRDVRMHQGANFKISETEHLTFYYTGDFNRGIKPLAGSSEAFLQELLSRWRVILPKEKLKISLFRVKPATHQLAYDFQPPWLSSSYSKRYQRIYLQVTPPQAFQLAKVEATLKHHLVEYLLHLNDGHKMPPFLELGLIQYYGGRRDSRIRYLTILGFQEVPQLSVFATASETYRDQEKYLFAGAMAREMVAWMWRQYPKSEQILVQQILQGQPYDTALSMAGLPRWNELVQAFEAEARPEYRVSQLFLTYDFLITLAGALVLLIMAGRVIWAFRISRMTFKEVAPLAVPVPASVPAAAFSGPAFGQPSMAQPATRPRPPRRSMPTAPVMPPPREPQSNREIDADLDRVFGEFPLAAGEAAAKSTQPASHTSIKAAFDDIGDIDMELDQVFDAFPTEDSSETETQKPALPKKEADIDAVLDDIIWDLE